MDALIVDQHSLHFEVCLLAGGLIFEFDESVLEAVAGAFVADDFAGENGAEAGEDGLEILVCSLLVVSLLEKRF